MNNCFDVKIVHHNNAVIKFLLQNENGPCPLIALINLLSLQGQLRLRAQSNSSSDAATATIVTTEWLLNALQDVLFEQQQNVQTVDQQDVVKVMTLLPTLISGLNTSLKFNGPLSFEPSDSLLLFKSFGATLCHGWCIDPQDVETFNLLGDRTYEECLDKLVAGDVANIKLENLIEQRNRATITAETHELHSAFSAPITIPVNNASSPHVGIVQDYQDPIILSPTSESAIHTSLIIQNFLASSASQITVYGIAALIEQIPESPPYCILFRNNHYHTLCKKNSQIYTLVTDRGFAGEEGIVWESLMNVEGDSQFFDVDFKAYTGSSSRPSSLSLPPPPPQHHHSHHPPVEQPHLVNDDPNHSSYDADLALAISLQQQEEEQQQQQLLQQQISSSRQHLADQMPPQQQMKRQHSVSKCVVM